MSATPLATAAASTTTPTSTSRTTRTGRGARRWLGLAGAVAALTASVVAVLPAASAQAAGVGVTTPVGPRSTIGVADPSGVPMRVGDLPGWRQVFADDFATDVPLGQFPKATNGKWKAYSDGWKDTSGNGTYMPSKVVSIDNGIMNLDIHTENGKHLVSAPVPVIPGTSKAGGMTYGKYSARFRADHLPGYKVAWLLWPDTDNWTQGEIDFPEGDLNSKMSAFMHFKGKPTAQDAFSTRTTMTSWHTVSIEWTPTAVTFLLDGKIVGQSTNTKYIPSDPMHWVLQTETALSKAAPNSSVRGNVQIDWVTAYARA